jgi:hypothetical protein
MRLRGWNASKDRFSRDGKMIQPGLGDGARLGKTLEWHARRAFPAAEKNRQRPRLVGAMFPQLAKPALRSVPLKHSILRTGEVVA